MRGFRVLLSGWMSGIILLTAHVCLAQQEAPGMGSTHLAASIPNRGMEAGSGKWMEIQDNPSIAIPVFTVEVWVKASSGGLIVTRDISTGSPSDWQLWYEFSRKRLAFITARTPPDTYFYTPDNSFMPNIWHHVALVVNGPAGYAHLYINGNLIISPTFSSRYFDCFTGLAWCGYYNNGAGAYLQGEIDEARYWNVERTQGQILATKDIDIPQADRLGLVGWWRFCDSFEDYSGAGNHGTPRGGPQLVLNTLPFGITCDMNPCDSVQLAIMGPLILCESDSATLEATPGFVSYQWSTGDTTQSIVARSAGKYTVTVIDINGCVAQASFDLTLTPLPVADAGPDIVVCNDISAQLGAMQHNPLWTYTWTPAAGLSSPDSAITRVRISSSRTYILEVINAAGCKSYDTVFVDVRSGLNLSLPDSLRICTGAAVTLPLAVLSGVSPYTFEWSPAVDLSAADIQNPVASPLSSQWYHVLVTDSMGCFAEDSILIVNSGGLETVLPDSIVICKNGSALLPLVVRPGSPPYRFIWTPATGLSATDVQTPLATPDSTTWYFVTVIDSLGCWGTDSVRVIPSGELQTILPDTIAVCANAAVVLPLQVNGGSGSLQYDWTPEADLSNPHLQQPVARPKKATTYFVHVSDSSGCEAFDSVTVIWYPWTDVSITIVGASSFCKGDSVLLRATPGFRSYRWNTPSRVIPDTGNTIMAREAGRYHVTVIDTNGCESVSLPVTITTFAAFQIPVSLHGNQPLCPGDSITLEAAEGYFDYIWSNDSGRVLGSGRHLTVGAGGSFVVVARDSSGCLGSSLPVIITMSEKPEFSITGSRIVCLNSTHEYSVIFRSRWTYAWSVTGGALQPPADRQAVRIQWTTPGRFILRLKVVDQFTGCADSAEYAVDVITGIQPQITAGGPTVFCEGDSVLLRSPRSYDVNEWRDSSGQIIGSGTSLAVHESGMYYFTPSTTDGCSGIDSMLVTVIPAPHPGIDGRIDVCINDTVTYALQNTGGRINWELSGGSIVRSDTAGITVLWDRVGTFPLIVTATSSDTALPCTGTDTLYVVVHPLPFPGLTAIPDTIICSDEWVVLTAAGGNLRYKWTTPGGVFDTTANQWRTNLSGYYSVTVVSSAGCESSSEPLHITVLPAPDAEIEGPITICNDGVGTYRVTGNPLDAYRWSVVGGLPLSDSTASTFDIRWSQAGTGLVAVVVDNGYCQAFDTLLVQIGDTLQPMITAQGPVRLCPGGEVELDAGNGYATYSWSTPEGVVTGQRIVARTAGSYRVRVSAASGCEGSSAALNVEMLPAPLPVIQGPASVCPGDTAILEASAGYLSYQWSDGSQGRFCRVPAPSVSSVTVVDSNGCTGTSDVHTVALEPVPTPPVITRDGMVLRSTPASSYQWYRNDSLLAGEMSRECVITLPGKYAVEIGSGSGCRAWSEILSVGCVTGTMVIALPHLLVSPGDTVTIEPSVLESFCVEELGTDEFIASIRFNKTLLIPIDTSISSFIDDGDCVVVVHSSLAVLRKQTLNLRFLATLGIRDSIPLILEKFEWVNAPVTVTVIDGSLRMRICREGGDRLFDSEGQVRLSQNRPNPFNASTMVEFETIEAGPTRVFVINSLGQRVRTLFEGNIDAGVYRVSFDASRLPSGNYICVLETPTVLLHRMMLLVK